MALDESSDKCFNDEELFIGKLSLNEIKYSLLPAPILKTSGSSASLGVENQDTSLKLDKSASNLSVRNSTTKLKYCDVQSPVALYIRGALQYPSAKKLKPKQPGPSAIPKFVKAQSQIKSNKENINLSLQNMGIKNELNKKPESQIAKMTKNVVSSVPRPVIRKTMREYQLKINQNDSFANLSLHQSKNYVSTPRPKS